MFKALPNGWGSTEVREFETKEEFFNPSLNPPSLNRHVSIQTLLDSFNQIFHRELVAEIRDLELAYISPESQIRELQRAIIMDERLHPILGMQVQVYWTEIEDEDDYDEIREGYNIEVEYFKVQSGEYLYNSYFSERYPADENISTPDLAEKIVSEIHGWINGNHGLGGNTLSEAHQSFRVDTYAYNWTRSPCLLAMWQHMIGKLGWEQAHLLPTGSRIPIPDSGIRSERVREQITNGNQIWIDGWGNGARPRFYLCIPHDSNDRSFFHRIYNYSQNVTQLLPGELRTPTEMSDNLYGIELEVAANVPPNTIIDATEHLYCIAKQDTSITGNKNSRYELVSLPATIKAHKQAWAQIFDKVPYTSFDVTRNTNNGMHIHIDMKAFHNKDGAPDSNHQHQFCWFFLNPVNRKFLQLLSERDDASWVTWMRFPELSHHHSLINTYRNVMNYVLPPYRGILSFKQMRDSHRTVTLEVRLFKGIVSLGAICKNLEFVDSLFNYTIKSNFQSNNIEAYLKYLYNTPKNRYATLKEFCSRCDMDDIINKARLENLVWGVNDAEKVLSIIKRRQFPIQQHHLTTLNSLIEGAKFGINKQGELTVIETNRSRLYDLDLLLQSKLNRKGNLKHVSDSHQRT